jgi:hypothetical protein
MGCDDRGNPDLAGLPWEELVARLDWARERYEDAIDGDAAEVAKAALQELLRVCGYIDERIKKGKAT